MNQEATLTMTANAIAHVKKQIQKRGSGIGVRVSVKETGCSGYSYIIDIVDEAKPEDQIFVIEKDLSIIVDPTSLPLIQGTHLDFVRQGLNEQFEFTNPNAKGTCGCGESFNL